MNKPKTLNVDAVRTVFQPIATEACEAVARRCGLTLHDLCAAHRNKNRREARAIVWWLLARRGLAWQGMAELLHRNRSVPQHAIGVLERTMAECPTTAAMVKALDAGLSVPPLTPAGQ